MNLDSATVDEEQGWHTVHSGMQPWRQQRDIGTSAAIIMVESVGIGAPGSCDKAVKLRQCGSAIKEPILSCGSSGPVKKYQ